MLKLELEKVNVLDAKWQFINDKIVSMKQMVSIKTAGVTEEHLVQIIEDFTDNLFALNENLQRLLMNQLNWQNKKKI